MMDIKTIKRTLQHIIDDVIPNTDHNITSLEMSQSKSDDEFVVEFTLVLKTEKDNKVGFGK